MPRTPPASERSAGGSDTDCSVDMGLVSEPTLRSLACRGPEARLPSSVDLGEQSAWAGETKAKCREKVLCPAQNPACIRPLTLYCPGALDPGSLCGGRAHVSGSCSVTAPRFRIFADTGRRGTWRPSHPVPHDSARLPGARRCLLGFISHFPCAGRGMQEPWPASLPDPASSSTCQVARQDPSREQPLAVVERLASLQDNKGNKLHLPALKAGGS